MLLTHQTTQKMDNNHVFMAYAYMYRNIRDSSTEKIITSEKAIMALRKIMHTAPRVVFREILYELQEMNLIKILNKEKIAILKSTHLCDKQLKKIRPYVFPLNPTIKK
jgi:hypothetical protein